MSRQIDYTPDELDALNRAFLAGVTVTYVSLTEYLNAVRAFSDVPRVRGEKVVPLSGAALEAELA